MVASSPWPTASRSSSASASLKLEVSPRVALAPATVRIRVRRTCSPEQRLLVLRVYWEDFPEPLETTERQLDGCDSPLTWDFPPREFREPGAYTVTADLVPTGEHVSLTAEYR
jgi:hypothetical protein